MPTATANGIHVVYDTFGAPTAKPLLLVMGLGTQRIFWQDDFCQGLADRGHFVIRFDNRDVGESTHLDDLGSPDVMTAFATASAGGAIEAPYLLSDMAKDAIGLLDALGISRAHVVGASMGGMIAQTMALEHAERVAALTSIMSTTGHPDLPPPSPEAMGALVMPRPSDREGFVEATLQALKLIGSPAYPTDDEEVRGLLTLAFDRAFNPSGMARQLVAILASGSRREALGALKVPTVVLHGDADPLVPPKCGEDTAASIPGAKLVMIEGMGHDLPRGVWPRITEEIAALTA